MQAEQERLLLAEKVETLEPKAAIAERLELADGLLNLSHAAKTLNIPPHHFNRELFRMGWIFRMGGTGAWTAYQDKIKAGFLEHKVYRQELEDGTEKVRPQVMITAKGMTRLVDLLNLTPSMGVAA